ncbi:MAG TPA: M23 family metallopeptidase [Rhodothermales bacterium]|nr:M23 family metallopeptidase [Rhodothermales bacterium]
MRRGSFLLFVAFLSPYLFGNTTEVSAQPLRLILPTSNHGLLHGDGPAFYQYTNRTFRGERSKPWQGGRYGFVRNEKVTRAGVVFTRFHEGVDIKPVYRDDDGEPMDTVRAIDGGRVVYANFEAGASDYGKYVVVEHWWSGSPFYSLYGHLGSVHVHAGQRVQQGDKLGIMGHTGVGIDRERSHVHFEIDMLLSRNFDGWLHATYRRPRNEHGIYNGLNMAGLDVAQLYLELQRDPNLTIREFIARQDVFFEVSVPNDHLLDLQYRYPWLAGANFNPHARSLEIGFTRSGLPVQIRSSNERVDEPAVSSVRPSRANYGDITNDLYSGRHGADLSRHGRHYIDLLTMQTSDTRSGIIPIAETETAPQENYPLARPTILPVDASAEPVGSVRASAVAEGGEVERDAGGPDDETLFHGW